MSDVRDRAWHERRKKAQKLGCAGSALLVIALPLSLVDVEPAWVQGIVFASVVGGVLLLLMYKRVRAGNVRDHLSTSENHISRFYRYCDLVRAAEPLSNFLPTGESEANRVS